MGAVLVLLAGSSWAARRAYAHLPIFTDHKATNDETAIPMLGPTISQVVYREITPDTKQIWLAFEAPEGLDLYVQVGVPVMARLRAFRPAMPVLDERAVGTKRIKAVRKREGRQ